MYTTGVYEVEIVKGVDLNSVADVVGGVWSPGYFPHILKAWGILIDNVIAAAGIIQVDKRILYGSDAGRVDNAGGTINIPNALAAGKDLYLDGLNLEVKPGEQLVWQVTDATGAGDTATIWALVEIRPEIPGNLTGMQATA